MHRAGYGLISTHLLPFAVRWLVAGFQYFVGECMLDLRGNRSLACLHVVQRALAACALEIVLVRARPRSPLFVPYPFGVMPVRGCPVSA